MAHHDRVEDRTITDRDFLNSADAMTDFNESVIARFRTTGGRPGGRFEGASLLLLTSRGSRSGIERTHPLAYFVHDGIVHVSGVYAGNTADPAWVRNVRVDPDVRVEIGTHADRATARELAGTDRDRVYAAWSADLPVMAEFARTAGRTIPVFALDGVDPPSR